MGDGPERTNIITFFCVLRHIKFLCVSRHIMILCVPRGDVITIVIDLLFRFPGTRRFAPHQSFTYAISTTQSMPEYKNKKQTTVEVLE